MYLFDTDTLSNFLDQRREHDRLRERIRDVPPEQRFTSIINVEELLQGQWQGLNAQRSKVAKGQAPEESLTVVYEIYRRLFGFLASTQVLPYDAAAIAHFKKIDPSLRRRHASDSRIAACAAAYGFVVVTCNLRHFQEFGVVKCEDWTRADEPEW